MIRVDHLNKTYDRVRTGDHRVLKDVSFQLPEKGFVCILGPSGCGKTSLLNALGGLDRFDNGSITAGDTTVSRYGTGIYEDRRNRSFGYIFQNYYLLEEHTAAYNIYLALHSLELTHREKIARIRAALRAVDMERYIHRKVGELSGGQQQRVAIARALARRPRVIFADEPTGNLDEANTMNICTLLRKASRDSLVIMVTHEEHIANFFADRIIRLDQGCVVSDSDSWDRHDLQMISDKEIYAGDLRETKVQGDHLKLRLLQTEGAAPVELTIIAAGDRVILKISDERTVSMTGAQDAPKVLEGKRPVMTLEALEQSEDAHMQILDQPPDAQCKAGKGIGFSMMFRQSVQLMHGKRLKQLGMRVFLVLMAVLMLVTIADFYSISKVDPLDFITSDSHILVVKIQQGANTVQDDTKLPSGYSTWLGYCSALYVEHIAQADTDFDFVPLYAEQPKYSFAPFYQMSNADQRMPGFSYVSLSRLDPETLICGRMPQNSEEIVIDKIVLDAILQRDGILQNGISNYATFLGEELNYGNRGLNPVIVGVCDSGERSLYATRSTLYALSYRGVVMITRSELQERYPGKYDVIEMDMGLGRPTRYFTLSELQDNECIMNAAQAGAVWKNWLGQEYGYAPNKKVAVAFLEDPDMAAHVIVTDAALEQMILRSYNQEIRLWCSDKAAMRAYLSEKTQMETDGYISVSISDPYAQKYAEYERAAEIRADGRLIVTAAILVLCMVMLYLLCHSRIHERIGLIAVYRLLGIPGRKLYGIFLLESVICALTTLIPTAALTWLGIYTAQEIPELESALELPWQAALVVTAGIVCFYLLVTVLPLARLLRYPPARLAAKYDV